MNTATIIFLAIVAFFAWRGYQKGFIGSITRVLSWLIAYPAAIIFTKPLAKMIVQNTALDGLIVYFVAGASIFLGVSFTVTLLLNLLARLIPQNESTEKHSKIGGAGVGVVMGSLAGLIAVYGIILLQKPDATPTATAQEEMATLPPVESTHGTQAPITHAIKAPSIKDLEKTNDSFIEASAKKLMGAAAATAVDIALDDKTATQVTKAFVQDPQSMLSHVQHVSNNGKMKELMADEKIQSLMATGDVQSLMKDEGFKALMNDEHMQALVATADNSAAGISGEQAAAEKMVAAWQRADSLKHDPRIIAIISDPEFQQQLNSPNKLALMMNPKLNQLTEIIFSSETPAANGTEKYEVIDREKSSVNSTQISTGTDSGITTEKKPPTKIYRWTDENGRVHYSDKEINP